MEQDRIAHELTLRDVGAEHPRTAYYAMVYARALRDAGRTVEAERLERGARPILQHAYPIDSMFRRAVR